MKKILVLVILFIITGISYSQQDNLIYYKVYKQGTVSGNTHDTTDLSKFNYYKFTLVGDSDLSYHLGGTLDSNYIKADAESITEPADGWYKASAFPQIIVWKKDWLSGTMQYRLWIWGKKF